MAYRLKPTETFATGFARVGLQQIDRIAGELVSQHAAHLIVHQSRKSLKRVRALLRLARPVLGDGVFQRENARYRGLGQMLAGARDRHVAVATVASLEAESGGRAKAAFATLRGWADAVGSAPMSETGLKEASAAADATQPGVFKRVSAQLDVARDGFGALVDKHASYEGALEGLARGYGLARRRFLHLQAVEDGADDGEAMHEWRKSVQVHWRHMALFSAAWPEEFEARIGVARQIAAVLGTDHDIAVVLAAALREDGAHLTVRQREAIQACAYERQAALRAMARGQARQLFAEDKVAFESRMALYWTAVVEQAQDAPVKSVDRRTARRSR